MQLFYSPSRVGKLTEDHRMQVCQDVPNYEKVEGVSFFYQLLISGNQFFPPKSGFIYNSFFFFFHFYVCVKYLININFFPTLGYLEVINKFRVKFWPINMCPLSGLLYFLTNNVQSKCSLFVGWLVVGCISWYIKPWRFLDAKSCL